MTHTHHILDQEVVTFIEVELNMDQVHFRILPSNNEMTIIWVSKPTKTRLNDILNP